MTAQPWHAIRVLPRREFTVADSIDDLGLESYCPRYRLAWTIRNRRREILTPYLFSWLFARWDADDAVLWHAIHSLTGVISFIGGKRPSPIPDIDILRLRERIGDDNRLIEAAPSARPFAEGDVVRIIEGPCAGLSGTVLWLHSSGLVARVEIIALLGRTIPLTCSASLCEPVPDRDQLVAESGILAISRSRKRRIRSRRRLEATSALGRGLV